MHTLTNVLLKKKENQGFGIDYETLLTPSKYGYEASFLHMMKLDV